MLEKPVTEDRSTIDAAIQRFEFTIELFWKLLKKILASKGVDVVYPKDVMRQAYAGHLIDSEQVWISMLRDRNITLHAYNEELADEIFNNIKHYYPVLYTTLQSLKKQCLESHERI